MRLLQPSRAQLRTERSDASRLADRQAAYNQGADDQLKITQDEISKALSPLEGITDFYDLLDAYKTLVAATKK